MFVANVTYAWQQCTTCTQTMEYPHATCCSTMLEKKNLTYSLYQDFFKGKRIVALKKYIVSFQHLSSLSNSAATVDFRKIRGLTENIFWTVCCSSSLQWNINSRLRSCLHLGFRQYCLWRIISAIWCVTLLSLIKSPTPLHALRENSFRSKS